MVNERLVVPCAAVSGSCRIFASDALGNTAYVGKGEGGSVRMVINGEAGEWVDGFPSTFVFRDGALSYVVESEGEHLLMRDFDVMGRWPARSAVHFWTYAPDGRTAVAVHYSNGEEPITVHLNGITRQVPGFTAYAQETFQWSEDGTTFSFVALPVSGPRKRLVVSAKDGRILSIGNVD